MDGRRRGGGTEPGSGEDRDEANGMATTVGGGSCIDFPANGMTTTVGGGSCIDFLCPWYV